MYRQQRTIALLACTILGVLLLSYSIYSLNQVPPLNKFERPDIPFDFPDMDIPINPEQTRLEIPETDIGNTSSNPLLKIDGQPNTQYLRLQTYDDYYSGTWDNSLTQSMTYNGESLDLDVNLWTDYSQYNITITPLADTTGYIPTPQNPVHLNLSDPTQFFEDAQIFQTQSTLGAYEIEYILYEYSDSLMNASKVEEIPQYLEVPDYLHEDIHNLAEEITRNTTTDYEAILALEDYLESYYAYNLSAAAPPSGVDPLEYFLFESGEGVCSHFNTALVMLARSLGFSARLVGGYYIDPYAPLQNVYPIQTHAFTEIPFKDLGWIIFDATPSGDISDMINEIPDLNLTDGENLFDDLDFDYPDESQISRERVFRIYGITGSEYLRDGVGEHYNGSWYSTSGLGINYDGQVIKNHVTEYTSIEEYNYVIEPSNGFNTSIPGPQNPVQIEAYDPLTYYPDQKIFKTNTTVVTPYGVISNQYAFSDTDLSRADTYVVESYLQIPDDLKSRIKPMAEQITIYDSTPYAKMQSLTGYLTANYAYNQSASDPPLGTDPVIWFIEYEKEGVCTDYAFALTLLARSIGIPARLVTGWLVNPEAEVQDVGALQAHAYTEVLFDDLGWIVFDATPISGPQVNESSGLIPSFTNITYQNEVVSVGGEFTVAGNVVDNSGDPVDALDVLVYLKQDKEESGVLAGRGVVSVGFYNISCTFPVSLPGGEYMVDVHTLGDDTYMDSWSDPPLVAYAETSFLVEAPRLVVSGKPYEVTATLVHSNTNKSIPHTPCQIDVGSTTFNRITDASGRVTFTTSSPEGVIEVTFSWDGTEYTYGSSTTLEIVSKPYQITLPPETEVTRGRGSIIHGKVHLNDVPGINEPVTLSFLGKETSTVTSEDGEFFITQNIPYDTPLGLTPLRITIPSIDITENSFAHVKSQTSLELLSPGSAQGGKRSDVTVKLTDDNGQPITSQMINLTYIRGNQTYSKSVQTDLLGEVETSIILPEIKGPLTLRAYYDGYSDYLSSSTSQVINILTPNSFPLIPLLALVLLTGGIVGLYYLRDQRLETLDEALPEVVESNSSSRLSLALPEIENGLPPVWNTEPLLFEGKMVSIEGAPISGENLKFSVGDTELYSGNTDEDGVVSFTTRLDKGVNELTITNESERLQTSLKIKIVEYREEIIKLFNNRFKEAKERFERINDNYTARELYNYLKEKTPVEAYDYLKELVFLFEEANYSLHVINRGHYTMFYKSMKSYKEALDGEIS